ncbi:filamentous hemagglutinin [Scytonema hofmannii PCC 7110]|uniref:Filamentous hemagglutinin n=2 Tax=Scytonema hofmannii TaxID=34078 RepID=A0A139WSZ1_9CYAN|nr:filamentous hemagglutinin [Scytonema hofmannii PCC 7110]
MRSQFLITIPLVSLGWIASINTAKAQVVPDNQITPDNSIGNESSVVIRNVEIPRIDGSTVRGDRIDGGAVRDTNLFHSFQEFNVGENGNVYFKPATNIQNILTRVTGTNPSNILGTLGVVSGNANLFFINPNGIVFGQNAQLDLRGSFLASTASSFKFPDGSEFSVTNPTAPSLLAINIPNGLQFRENPGAIRVQGTTGNALTFNVNTFEFQRNQTPDGLKVQSGKTLALVGGGVTLERGNLITDGGRIEVGSVAGSSLVSLTSADKGWRLGYSGMSSFQDILLSQKASIDVSSEEGSGEIQVQGRNIKLTDGSAIFAFTGSKSGGTVSVNASELLEVTGVSANGSVPSTLYTAVFPETQGTGGDLILETKRFIAQGGAQIGADTYGVGNAGNVLLKAFETVELQGTSADEIIPTALGTVVQVGATGAGANLTVETRRLRVQDGAQLVTFTFSQGTAANIVVKASESAEFIGKSSALSSSVNPGSVVPEAKGNGGIIDLETPQLIVRDEAKITASSLGENSGDAGDLKVTAGSIRLDKGIIEAVSNSGNGGNINLAVQDLLLMRNSSLISADAGTEATGGGNGGNIFINNRPGYRGFVIARPNENSDITANAFTGQGGQVVINSNGIYGFVSRSSQDLERLRPNDLRPNDFGPREIPTNDITAISRQNPSLSGTVTLTTPEVDPKRGLIKLPENVIDPTQMIAQNPCQRGVGSEFIVTGRGGLPPSPNQILGSDNVRVDLVEPVANTRNSNSTTQNQQSPSSTIKQIVPAKGWVFNEKGKIVLTAYDPTSTGFQRSWQTPAACPAF